MKTKVNKKKIGIASQKIKRQFPEPLRKQNNRKFLNERDQFEKENNIMARNERVIYRSTERMNRQEKIETDTPYWLGIKKNGRDVLIVMNGEGKDGDDRVFLMNTEQVSGLLFGFRKGVRVRELVREPLIPTEPETAETETNKED